VCVCVCVCVCVNVREIFLFNPSKDLTFKPSCGERVHWRGVCVREGFVGNPKLIFRDFVTKLLLSSVPELSKHFTVTPRVRTSPNRSVNDFTQSFSER
jgi:hypothetical protein